MSLIKCPECKKEVSDSAESCPHCGYGIKPKPEVKKEEPKKSGPGCFTILIWTVLIIIGILVIGNIYNSYRNNGTQYSSSTTNDDIKAYRLSKEAVIKRLKAPGTAEFPGIIESKDHYKEVSYGRFEINSWVDSQNSFGAMIRQNYSCTMVKSGGSWSTEDLEFY